MEGKTLRQQKVYNIYCDIRFILMVWVRTHNIAEVCLNPHLKSSHKEKLIATMTAYTLRRLTLYMQALEVLPNYSLDWTSFEERDCLE